MENFSIRIDENVRLRLYKICRLCGDDNPNNTEILVSSKKNSNVDPDFHKKIYDCVGIQITKGDKMPQTACNVCREKINDFFDFREMCLASDVQTRRLLGLPDVVVPKPDPAFDSLEDDKTEVEKSIKKKNPAAAKSLKTGKSVKAEKRATLDSRKTQYETKKSSMYDSKKATTLYETKKSIPDGKKVVKLERDKTASKVKKKVGIGAKQPIDPKNKYKDNSDKFVKAKKRKASGDLLTEKPPNKRERLRENVVRKLKNPLVALDTVSLNVFCTICNMSFCNAGELHRHLDTDHLPRVVLFHCVRCNESIEKKQAIKNHNLWHKLSKTPYECGRCAKHMMSLAMYTKHIQNCSAFVQHFEYKTKKCSICKEQFATQNLYNWHKCIINQLKCEVCQQKFSKRAAMLKHVVRCTAIGLSTSLPVVDSALDPELGSDPDAEPLPEADDHFADANDSDDGSETEMNLKPNLEIDIEAPRAERRSKEKHVAPFVVIPSDMASVESSRPNSNSSSSLAIATPGASNQTSVQSNNENENATGICHPQSASVNASTPMVCIELGSNICGSDKSGISDRNRTNSVRIKSEIIDSSYKGLYDSHLCRNIKQEVDSESGSQPSVSHPTSGQSDSLKSSNQSNTLSLNANATPKPTLKLVIKKQHGTLNSSFVDGSNVLCSDVESVHKRKKKKKSKVYKIPKGLALKMKQDRFIRQDVIAGTNNENQEHISDRVEFPNMSQAFSKRSKLDALKRKDKNRDSATVLEGNIRIKQERRNSEEFDRDADVIKPSETNPPNEAVDVPLLIISQVISEHLEPAVAVVKDSSTSNVPAINPIRIKQEIIGPEDENEIVSDEININTTDNVDEAMIPTISQVHPKRIEPVTETGVGIANVGINSIQIKREQIDIDDCEENEGESGENVISETISTMNRDGTRYHSKRTRINTQSIQDDVTAENSILVANIAIKQERIDADEYETDFHRSGREEAQHIHVTLPVASHVSSKPKRQKKSTRIAESIIQMQENIRIKEEKVDDYEFNVENVNKESCEKDISTAAAANVALESDAIALDELRIVRRDIGANIHVSGIRIKQEKPDFACNTRRFTDSVVSCNNMNIKLERIDTEEGADISNTTVDSGQRLTRIGRDGNSSDAESDIQIKHEDSETDESGIEDNMHENETTNEANIEVSSLVQSKPMRSSDKTSSTIKILPNHVIVKEECILDEESDSDVGGSVSKQKYTTSATCSSRKRHTLKRSAGSVGKNKHRKRMHINPLNPANLSLLSIRGKHPLTNEINEHNCPDVRVDAIEGDIHPVSPTKSLDRNSLTHSRGSDKHNIYIKQEPVDGISIAAEKNNPPSIGKALILPSEPHRHFRINIEESDECSLDHHRNVETEATQNSSSMLRISKVSSGDDVLASRRRNSINGPSEAVSNDKNKESRAFPMLRIKSEFHAFNFSDDDATQDNVSEIAEDNLLMIKTEPEYDVSITARPEDVVSKSSGHSDCRDFVKQEMSSEDQEDIHEIPCANMQTPINQGVTNLVISRVESICHKSSIFEKDALKEDELLNVRRNIHAEDEQLDIDEDIHLESPQISTEQNDLCNKVKSASDIVEEQAVKRKYIEDNATETILSPKLAKVGDGETLKSSVNKSTLRAAVDYTDNLTTSTTANAENYVSDGEKPLNEAFELDELSIPPDHTLETTCSLKVRTESDIEKHIAENIINVNPLIDDCAKVSVSKITETEIDCEAEKLEENSSSICSNDSRDENYQVASTLNPEITDDSKVLSDIEINTESNEAIRSEDTECQGKLQTNLLQLNNLQDESQLEVSALQSMVDNNSESSCDNKEVAKSPKSQCSLDSVKSSSETKARKHKDAVELIASNESASDDEMLTNVACLQAESNSTANSSSKNEPSSNCNQRLKDLIKDNNNLLGFFEDELSRNYDCAVASEDKERPCKNDVLEGSSGSSCCSDKTDELLSKKYSAECSSSKSEAGLEIDQSNSNVELKENLNMESTCSEVIDTAVNSSVVHVENVFRELPLASTSNTTNFSVQKVLNSPGTVVHPIPPAIVSLPNVIVSSSISPSATDVGLVNTSLSAIEPVASDCCLNDLPHPVPSKLNSESPTQSSDSLVIPHASDCSSIASRSEDPSTSDLNILHMNEIAENNNNANIERELQNDLESISSNSNLDFDT